MSARVVGAARPRPSAVCTRWAGRHRAILRLHRLTPLDRSRLPSPVFGPSVKVSAKTEYACIAMLELAASYGSGEPVRIRKIASEHGVPSRFLVQILLQLKGAGLVNSTRGAA